MTSNPVSYAILLSLLAGISTGIGGLMVIFFKKTNTKLLSVILGFSAGIMIYISFIEIYQEAQESLMRTHGEHNAKILTALAFFLGITLMAFINQFVPEPDQPHRTHKIEEAHRNSPKSKLFKTGLVTALAVTIHNFPEGMATFVSSVKNPTLGFSIALAIAIHNIPEGIAISVPLYYATKNKTKAFLISLLSGLSEPLGAIITLLILGPLMTDTLSGIIFGMVAGFMVYISLDELLPTAREYGDHHLSILGLMLGMALMALSISLLF